MAKEEKENEEGWDEKLEVEEGAKTKSEDEKLREQCEGGGLQNRRRGARWKSRDEEEVTNVEKDDGKTGERAMKS